MDELGSFFFHIIMYFNIIVSKQNHECLNPGGKYLTNIKRNLKKKIVFDIRNTFFIIFSKVINIKILNLY